jgi:hypothetical protein
LRLFLRIKQVLPLSRLREAQNCLDKKTLIFFFYFLVLSGKFGKQSLRFCAAITFVFGITVFLYQNKIPVDHMLGRKQFRASLKDEVRQHA